MFQCLPMFATTKKLHATETMKYVYKIHVPKGTPCLCIGNEEVLFPPNVLKLSNKEHSTDEANKNDQGVLEIIPGV